MNEGALIHKLSSDAVQKFIFEHEHDDERELILHHKEILGVASSVIGNQIAGRRKAKIKLPAWSQQKGIVYPPSLNLEQSSSEATALFKSSIVQKLFPSGKKISVADLTGGFGIDSFYLSKVCHALTYIEANEALIPYARHNHHLLGAVNIKYRHEFAEDFLSSSSDFLDLIYIDPSRRSDSKKVFRLIDCIPNVVALYEKLLKRSSLVLLKCSPMLDIQQALRDLEGAKQVWVVSVGNECKELLFLLDPVFDGEPIIQAVELAANGVPRENFDFTFSEERACVAHFSDPLHFLYEPNASLLKAGAFKSIGEQHHLFKLSTNTHLYTSANLIENFPGRIFKILCADAGASEIKSLLPEGKANVLTRNYPLSPAALKKKLKLKDGGDFYVIGYSAQKKKFISIATRVK